ncbi:MAG: U32 family peptidase [Spirochaetales bacterium]|nr:U32 family peptidase [Spirochaetales bacterium]
MDFSVATNWDFALIEELSGYPVYEFLGAMAKNPIGGGRPAVILPEPESKKIEEYIKEVHKKGIKFNYLLNAQCLGNTEYDKTMHQSILKHIEWLCKIGVDSVTVSIPYLIQIIKKQFPSLKIKASVIAAINSIQRAHYYEEMGVDEINLDYMSNRDFNFLSKVKKNTHCSLVLLANDICLYQCPYRIYHYNTTAHASQNWCKINTFYIDYCMINCTLQFLNDPAKIIMSRWIRPEDLPIYEKEGYTRFKISGRNMSTTWLTRAVKAYSQKKYNGNLFDILAAIAIKIDPEENSYCYIDNSKLDGFLEIFKKKDCINSCSECHYCETIAKKTVSYNKKRADYLKKSFQELKDNLIQSKYFL